jgi:hypothetical protein
MREAEQSVARKQSASVATYYAQTFVRHAYSVYRNSLQRLRILQALRWHTFLYPKREPSPKNRVQVVDHDLIPKTFAAVSAH